MTEARHVRRDTCLLAGLAIAVCLLLAFALMVGQARRSVRLKLYVTAAALGCRTSPMSWEGKGAGIPWLVPADRRFPPRVRLTPVEMSVLRAETWASNLFGWLSTKLEGEYRYVNVGTLRSWLARGVYIDVRILDNAETSGWVGFGDPERAPNTLDVHWGVGG
ncbi:MAG: hypothetical protein A3K19_24750 [Lentisphaerae bacterium RIFOXYB12_FULL_65_16]|nr:MAG: hypothetical protein A3K18_24165 [Lentisphaerae bacterium RIFOXYA12_64_32]OGV90681.1 MAG: hypothetical protein A3K19_24750 [Lentisphaerae bacterium RIFOXYB12_FULL_65_16]